MKRLSLYSSDTEIEGVRVTGPRWAGGARSPNSSSGYGARDGPGLGGAGAGAAVGGACSPVPRGGGCWPHAWAAVNQSAIPTIAPPRARNRPHTLMPRTMAQDYRADRSFPRCLLRLVFDSETHVVGPSKANLISKPLQTHHRLALPRRRIDREHQHARCRTARQPLWRRRMARGAVAATRRALTATWRRMAARSAQTFLSTIRSAGRRRDTIG